MSSSRVPATLLTGATGAGKTTFVSRLIARRPPGARWAVLVNDSGLASVSGVPGAVTVREVTGCICCTGRVALRTALVALLRESRPQRLLIEASASAHPSAIVKVLEEPGLASAIALERTLCLVDPLQVVDARYAGSELYREQLKAADGVILGGTDAVTAAQRDAALAVLERLGTARVVEAQEALLRSPE
jgi:G3E family GTPase